MKENRHLNKPWREKGKRNYSNPKFWTHRIGDIDPDAPEWYKREPDVALAWAKEQYLRGVNRAYILSRTGLNPNQLLALINGSKTKQGWKVQREKVRAKAIEREILEEKDRVSALLEKSLDIMEKGLNHIGTDINLRIDAYNKDRALLPPDAPPNRAAIKIDELEKVMKVTNGLFAMKKVGEALGLAVVNNLTVNITPESIIKRLKNVDPFGYGDVIDVTGADSPSISMNVKRLNDVSK